MRPSGRISRSRARIFLPPSLSKAQSPLQVPAKGRRSPPRASAATGRTVRSDAARPMPPRSSRAAPRAARAGARPVRGWLSRILSYAPPGLGVEDAQGGGWRGGCGRRTPPGRAGTARKREAGRGSPRRLRRRPSPGFRDPAAQTADRRVERDRKHQELAEDVDGVVPARRGPAHARGPQAVSSAEAPAKKREGEGSTAGALPG